MPYRRRYSSRRRSERKPLIWTPCTINAPLNWDGTRNNNVKEGDIYKVCDISLTEDADREVILERIRGGMFWETAGTQGAINAVIFGVILPDIVAGNVHPGAKLENFPTPADSSGTDDFPLVMDACAPTATTSTQVTGQAPIMVDVKAKRKMDKDKLLTIAIHVLDIIDVGVGSPQYKAVLKGFIRVLQKIL